MSSQQYLLLCLKMVSWETSEVTISTVFYPWSANEPSIVKTLQVIDGGALLHRIKWAKKVAYKDIVEQYVCYIRARYGGSSCIVFDGHGYGPSIKDHEQQRKIRKTCADIDGKI